MNHIVRFFGFSLAATAAALLWTTHSFGLSAGLITVVLILVELTFSFDNAVINAKILQTLTARWQLVFLTVGILIAIIGMRIVFPILIVSITAHLPWAEVMRLALHNPDEYARRLGEAHHSIAAFGGAFLLMISLHFFFDDGKDVHWFTRFEQGLQKYGNRWLPALITGLVVWAVALLPDNTNPRATVQAGILGVVTYLAIRSIERLFASMRNPGKRPAKAGHKKPAKLQTGWPAFATFIYLEILDASFSFDGVIGAFAITKSVVLIAVGLGVGALWVRSLTVYMVKRGTLGTYRYLEHGAHYTVGVLALVLLISVVLEVPDFVAGLAGVLFVSAAFISSRRENAREALSIR